MPAVSRTTSLSSISSSTSPSAPSKRIPRPPNAWILYRSARSEIHKHDPLYSNLKQVQLSQLIAQEWAHESPAVKDHYAKLAQRKKEEHQALYPNYVFQPVRKVEKERRRTEAKAEREKVQEERSLAAESQRLRRARMVYPPVLKGNTGSSGFFAGTGFDAPQQCNAPVPYNGAKTHQPVPARQGGALTMQEAQAYLDAQIHLVQGPFSSQDEFDRMMFSYMNPVFSL